MEVCDICGAFLVMGDAQQRVEEHLLGKQHMGYGKVRDTIDMLKVRMQKKNYPFCQPTCSTTYDQQQFSSKSKMCVRVGHFSMYIPVFNCCF